MRTETVENFVNYLTSLQPTEDGDPWWTNGFIEIRQAECPGPGYYLLKD